MTLVADMIASSCGVVQLEAEVNLVYMGEAEVQAAFDDDGTGSDDGGVKKRVNAY